MLILGIETSCDETAASIIEGKENKIKVLSNVVSSQIEIHKKYGGVVPEVAARQHVLNILPVVNEALAKAKIKKNQASQKIKAIAVTIGPGLITSLLVGVETAKTLSYAWNIPIIPVNHIEGHIYANYINNDKIKFPAIILTVSGGHTMLVLMKNHLNYKTIGDTRDDAAGEAFDKGAKLLGLGYPGGPEISKTAEKFKKTTGIEFPRPMMHDNNFDFSFSGIKTSLLYKIQKDKNWKKKIPEYCYEYQQAIIDTLIYKTIKAEKKYKAKTIMLAGGVSANKQLRQQFSTKITSIKSVMPDTRYATDNAAMVATAGYFKLKAKQTIAWRKLKASPNLKLR
ncbi:MAG: tRNA (adenosine(37)-N6)-threonylcarbamoyltransferase complex transferase subunit TsaD [bacterium]